MQEAKERELKEDLYYLLLIISLVAVFIYINEPLIKKTVILLWGLLIFLLSRRSNKGYIVVSNQF